MRIWHNVTVHYEWNCMIIDSSTLKKTEKDDINIDTVQNVSDKNQCFNEEREKFPTWEMPIVSMVAELVARFRATVNRIQ